MATLLEICTRALDEISSFHVPNFIIGNTEDGTARQLLASAKKVGTELVRDYDWQQMTRTATVTTVIDTGSYPLEADYERMVSDTAWNTATDRRLMGQTSKREWALITTLEIATGDNAWFRLAQDEIQVKPTPSSVYQFTYEYLSKHYCRSNSGDNQAEWTNDTDVPLLPEDLFIYGVKFYFLKAKNLPYGNAEAEYDAVVSNRQGRNTPSATIDMKAGVVPPGSMPGGCLNFPQMIPNS